MARFKRKTKEKTFTNSLAEEERHPRPGVHLCEARLQRQLRSKAIEDSSGNPSTKARDLEGGAPLGTVPLVQGTAARKVPRPASVLLR